MKTITVNKIKSNQLQLPKSIFHKCGLQKNRGTHIEEKQITKILNIFLKTNNVPSQQENNTSNSKPNSVALLEKPRKYCINTFIKNQEKKQILQPNSPEEPSLVRNALLVTCA